MADISALPSVVPGQKVRAPHINNIGVAVTNINVAISLFLDTASILTTGTLSQWAKSFLSTNFVLSGFTVSAGAGLVLNIAAGSAVVEGYRIDMGAGTTFNVPANTVAGYLYLQLLFAGVGGAYSGAQFVLQTGVSASTPPANSVTVAYVESNATLVTTATLKSLPDGQARTRSAGFVIAASNSSRQVKSGADFICTGTNDEVTINNALFRLTAIGGSVFLAAGTYTIGASISIPSNVELRGDGTSTIITTALTTALIMLTNTITSGDIGLRIRDLKVVGNPSATAGTQTGISITGSATNILIDGCVVATCSNSGISVVSTGKGDIVNTFVNNCQGTGIVMASNNSTVENCDSSSNGAYGILVSGTDVKVKDCHVSSNANYGILMAAQCTVSGCTLLSNTGGGINIPGVADCNVTGNVLSANSNVGINIATGSVNCGITGNRITGGTNGVAINGGPYLLVSSNNVSTTSGAGISVSTTSVQVIVSNNTVTGYGGAGIIFGAQGGSVVGNNCNNGTGYGIDLSNCDFTTCTGNHCAGNNVGGIKFAGNAQNYTVGICDNVCEVGISSPIYGIVMLGGWGIQIHNNRINGGSTAGIYVDIPTQSTSIQGNVVRNTGTFGIRINGGGGAGTTLKAIVVGNDLQGTAGVSDASIGGSILTYATLGGNRV